MVDAVKDEEGGRGESSTLAFDQTVQLDRVIAERNPAVPERFGRYEVIARIGIGGFASVFSARDPDLDATVAIKVLAENHSADVEVRKRFVAEARVARRLGGDRLIGVFDLGETDDGRPYVVMELATGGTLRARLNRIGRPSPSALLRLIDELGACMEAVHANGVVHRDIKPSNLLLRTSGDTPKRKPSELIADNERLVLADFGLARDISGGASAVTVGGGTAGYMAPEQADPNGKADVRADLFAATVVLAELTTGRHPERLDLATANVSEPVRQALARGMSLDRHQRPSTAMTWRHELRAAYTETVPPIAHAEPTAEPESEPPAEPHGELTLPIDATQVQAPHQFRNRADAEYDESGLAEPTPANAASDTSSDASPDSPPIEVDTSAPTRHLDDVGTTPEDRDGPGPGRDATEHTAIQPDDQRPMAKPRTFVRPVVDEEPPPPPPSIPLSPRAQRPPPGYGSDEPAAPPSRLRNDAAESPPAAAEPSGQPAAAAPAPATASPPPPTAPAVTPGAAAAAASAPAPVAEVGPRSGNAPPHRESPQAPTSPPPRQPHQPVRQPVGRPAAPIPGLPAPPTTARQPVGHGPQPRNRYTGTPPQRPGTVPSRRVAPPPTKAQIKQQQRLLRQAERRRRWRRRRRRFSNLLRALIRGVLAWLVMSVIAAVLISAQTGNQISNLSPNAESVVNLVGIVSFFLGLRWFPWPRRLDPHG